MQQDLRHKMVWSQEGVRALPGLQGPPEGRARVKWGLVGITSDPDAAQTGARGGCGQGMGQWSFLINNESSESLRIILRREGTKTKEAAEIKAEQKPVPKVLSPAPPASGRACIFRATATSCDDHSSLGPTQVWGSRTREEAQGGPGARQRGRNVAGPRWGWRSNPAALPSPTRGLGDWFLSPPVGFISSSIKWVRKSTHLQGDAEH